MKQAKLTRGNPRAQLVALSLPLLLGNLLQQLYNAADAVIVGRFVGEAAFGAVGVAGSVMNLFLFLISGSCDGAGALLSRFYGAGDRRVFRRGFGLFGFFGGGAVLGLAALGLGTLSPLLDLLQTPEGVAAHAREYLPLIFLGLPAAFAYHLTCGILRAAGNSGAALVFLALSVGGNLALDWAFVAGLSMGVRGAALATVLAQALAACLCAAYLRHRFPDLMFSLADLTPDSPLLRRIARCSLAAALHMCSLYIGKLLVQGTVNALGQEAVAAFTAAARAEGLANSFGDSGSAAMSVFTGQNTGAGREDRVRRGFLQGERLLAALGAVMSLAMLLGAEPVLSRMLPVSSPESLGPAVGYLRLVACFYLFNFLGSGFAGFLRGRGRVGLPAIGAAGHISLRAALSWLLAPRLGLSAVALATGLGWVCVVSFWTPFLLRELPKEK